MLRFVPVLVAVFALPLAAAPVPKAAKKRNDAEAILGRWQGTVATNNVRQQTDYTFRFSDDGTCGITTGANGRESPATYTIDPAGSPKRMTWNSGPWQCVYELDGDTLRIGFIAQQTDVPAGVEVKDAPTVYELKRVSDDK